MPDNTRRARDEQFWKTFADRYAVEPGPINLENGYFGRMSRTVVEEYQRNIELINRSNSVHVRQRFEQGESLQILAQLAGLLGVPADTVALTRNASDGLQSLIRNYNRLQPGDQVLICDLEYDTVKGAMRWLAKHRGVEVIEIDHQHPASAGHLSRRFRALSKAQIDGPDPRHSPYRTGHARSGHRRCRQGTGHRRDPRRCARPGPA
jgi:selenocysteine lyase/cysteine desulfurase